jgi:hypothetical protein
MRAPRIPLLLAFLAGLVVAPAATHAAAAMPSKKFVHEKHGFLVKLVRDWTRTPTQPGETLEVAKFKSKVRGRGEFASVSIRRWGSVSDPGDDDESGSARDPNRPAGVSDEQWEAYREQRRASGSAHSYFKSLLNQNRRRFGMPGLDKLPEPKSVKMGKVKGELYDIEMELEGPAARWTRNLYFCAGIAEKNGEQYLVLFTAPSTQIRKYRRSFQASIKSFRFADEVKASLQPKEVEEEDFPVDADYVDQEKRNRIKRELIDSWSFIDTPHYIVIYDCDKPLARTIAKRIERMRTQCFETWFEPIHAIKEVAVVRVCRDPATYHHYGGPPGTGGYWASGRDELVFPDASRSKKADKITLGVLHHEGWHQYLHYALGGRASQISFNEGIAEFFFCAKTKGRKKMSIGNRHPMRHGTVKTAASTGKLCPTGKFLRLTQREHYSNSQLHYSQGWAFFYWLLKGTRNEAYKQIPRKIYRNLAEMAWRDAIDKALEGIDEEQLHEDFLKGIKKTF